MTLSSGSIGLCFAGRVLTVSSCFRHCSDGESRDQQVSLNPVVKPSDWESFQEASTRQYHHVGAIQTSLALSKKNLHHYWQGDTESICGSGITRKWIYEEVDLVVL